MRTNALLEELMGQWQNIEPSILSLSFPDKNFSISAMTEMQEPSKATNNCWNASEAINRNIDFNNYLSSPAKQEVSGILSNAGNHYAVLLTRESGGYCPDGVIIDFTARQFDANADFPLILDMWQWQEWVENKIQKYGEWLHENGYVPA